MENILVIFLALFMLTTILFPIIGIVQFIRRRPSSGFKNLGLAVISFALLIGTGIFLANESNKKSEADEIAADVDYTSDDSSTPVDFSDESIEDDPEALVQSEIEDIISNDFEFDTSLLNFELNDNLGTDKKDDYIALVYLSYDQTHSEKTTKKWIDTYTNHLAAKLGEDEPSISSLTIFWKTPRFKEGSNTAKFSLFRKGKEFYFENKWYDTVLN